jgi:hypothetical protein
MVTRWSGEALAELKSLEVGSTAVVTRWVRQRAQQLASEGGREQVEAADLKEAVGQYFDQHYPASAHEEDDATSP